MKLDLVYGYILLNSIFLLLFFFYLAKAESSKNQPPSILIAGGASKHGSDLLSARRGYLEVVPNTP